MEPRGDVGAVAKDIAVSLDNVAEVNADTDMNLRIFFFVDVIGAELGLDLLGTLDSIDDGGELDKKSVANEAQDLAVLCCDGVLNNRVVGIEQVQRPGLIGADLAAKADHVGEHDGGEPPLLGGHCAAVIVLHGYGLFCWRCLAINCLLPF